MTPADLIDIAKRRYNAVNDDFFPEAEMLDLIWEAEVELARHTLHIEEIDDTQDTVISQQGYDFPTGAIAIKRIEYEGKKLTPITFRVDDSITTSDSDTTATGEPSYYTQWKKKFYLRPVPDTVGDLKIYYYGIPDEVLIGDSDLDTPEEFQKELIYYLLMEMAAKDNNWPASDRYERKWEATKRKARSWAKRKKRGDSPAQVVDVDSVPQAVLEIAYFSHGW